MKLLFVSVMLLAAGCSAPSSDAPSVQPAVPVAKPVALTPQQELAKFCRVCVVDRGEKMPEFLPSRLNTKRAGQSYKFCADDCRKKFDANPKRYVLAAK